MINLNSKEASFQKALYAYAFNDALEPTGLGSIGVLLNHQDLEIYIGIKYDVIDVITNKNANFVINLEDEVISASETIDKDKDSEYKKTFYINDVAIELDLAKFRAYVLRFEIDAYRDLFIKSAAKETKTLGALLRIEIPFELGIDGLFIGYIYTEDKERLVLNKAIVDKETLKDDARYSIWKIKQNITRETLKKDKISMLFEKTRSYAKKGYNDYFSNQYDIYLSAPTKKEISLKRYDNSKDAAALGEINDKFYKNLDYDVFSIDSYAIAPGIVNGENMTNFGLKEARRGYFNLEKGKTFTNIGYEADDTIFSDNFYISPSGESIEPLSFFTIPQKTEITYSPLLINLSKIPEYAALRGFLDSFLYTLRPYTISQAKEIAYKEIDKAKIDAQIKEILKKTLKIKLSLAYYHLTQKDSQDICVFTHPFYEKAFLAHTSEDFIEAANSHTFGFKDGKYYFKGIDKEYRDNRYIQVGDDKIYKDLVFDEKALTIKGKFINDFQRNLVLLETNIHNVCFVYKLSSERLPRDEYSISSYPFGAEKIYIKVEK